MATIASLPVPVSVAEFCRETQKLFPPPSPGERGVYIHVINPALYDALLDSIPEAGRIASASIRNEHFLICGLRIAVVRGAE